MIQGTLQLPEPQNFLHLYSNIHENYVHFLFFVQSVMQKAFKHEVFLHLSIHNILSMSEFFHSPLSNLVKLIQNFRWKNIVYPVELRAVATNKAVISSWVTNPVGHSCQVQYIKCLGETSQHSSSLARFTLVLSSVVLTELSSWWASLIPCFLLDIQEE